MGNRRTGLQAGAVCLSLAVCCAWLGAARATQNAAGEVALPKPQTAGGMSLNEALAKRRSQRAFTDRPLTLEQVSQLCWAAQGTTEPVKGLRTAPSAMETYPIHLFVVEAAGCREYLSKSHALRQVKPAGALADLRTAVRASSVGTAPAVFVVAMDLTPLQPRAGAKAERFALLESGHVAQNLLLEATALGLAGVPIGGPDEEAVAKALELGAGLRPVYVIPVGLAAAR